MNQAMHASVRVQRETFDAGAELTRFMARTPLSGGIASFVGQVRDFRGPNRAGGVPVAAMTLEHYPGMAERELAALCAEAQRRWSLDDVFALHRYGALKPGEAIVFVATAAPHRADAFAACEFMVDWLKTKAPFWKKEATPAGERWVAAHADDDARAERWKER
jgi:molybdopterin synthase catalytic subunit